MNEYGDAELQAPYVFDASAVVKLVVEEPGSRAVNGLFHSGGGALCFTSPVSLVEALTVLKRRWASEKTMDINEYFQAASILTSYTQHGWLKLAGTQLAEPGVLVSTMELARRHTLDLADALQLYSIKAGTFSDTRNSAQPVLVTGDRALALAARAEGLLAWLCTAEPEPPVQYPRSDA